MVFYMPIRMQKSILFISVDKNPFDLSYGSTQRSNLLLRACLQLGNVDVVCFNDEVESNLVGCKVVYSKKTRHVPNQMTRAKKWFGLLSPWNPYSFYPIDTEKEIIIDQLVSQKLYDAIVVRYMPEAMACGLMKYADRLVIDIDDHPKDTLKMTAMRAASKPNKLYYHIASILSHFTVRHLSNRIRVAFFSNPCQVIGSNGCYLPNVPFDEPITDFVRFDFTTPRLFFVGLLDYYPNYSGMDYFIDNVWPMIKSAIPSAELHIAGKIKGEEPESLCDKWRKIKGVSVLGFVDNINIEYEACRASISPIYVGAGTNIKLLESMQRKRVCITTDVGVRGMKSFFSAGKEVLVANNADEYAQMCIRALTDENFNHHIAQDAFVRIEEKFSHDSFNRIVKKVLENN